MSEKYNTRTEKREKINEQKKRFFNKKGSKKIKATLWKKILFTCFTLFLFVLLVSVVAFFTIIKDAPTLDETLLKSPQSSQILASDGETEIAEIGAEKRDSITLNQIPDVLKNAVLATEDAHFYEHHGIDIKRTIAAVLSNITNGTAQGGSTITQQVVKNVFLTNEKTFTRKIQEWYLAVQLESSLTKDQILEIYFNRNLYGGDIYGVAKAAERFFGLSPDELDQLTLEQAALLAGIPQRPNSFNPSIEDNLEGAEKRRNLVLQYMNRQNYISKETMEEAQSTPIEDTLHLQQVPANQYQAFVDTVITEVQEKTNANIFEDGLTIYTTLNPEIQQITEDVISTNDYIHFPDNDNLETGVVILDTQTGAVQAIGGGRNYQTGNYNYATMLKRQPGSTLKPLISYGPAINKLRWSTGHLIVDEEYQYSNGQTIRNNSRTYSGEQTIREHLTWSRNIPSLKTYQEVGADYAVNFARNLGIPISDEQANNESNALGAIDNASPLIMAGAYAAFGNGGYYIEPYTVSKITYSDGEEVNLTPNKEKAMEDYTAFMITDMLRTGVQSGSGKMANISGLDLAGKTGTTSFGEEAIKQYGLPSDATRDAWFVGYTPQYTSAVWTGYSQTTSSDDYLGSTSVHFSKLIFKEIMSRVATSTEKFEQPDSVGKLGNEYYVKGGEEPKAPKPDAVKNLKGTYNADSDSIQLSWEFSSDDDTETTFSVSYTVDGKTTKLPATSDMSASLPNPEKGKTYEFSVVAAQNEAESDPVTVSVQIPDEEEQPEVPDSPKNIKPKFDSASNSIVVDWKHNNSENVTFTVTYTVDGDTKSLPSTSETQVTLSNPEVGKTYTFTVIASNSAGSSSPSSASITVPGEDNSDSANNGHDTNKSDNDNSGNNSNNNDDNKNNPDSGNSGNNSNNNGDNKNNPDSDNSGNNNNNNGDNTNNPDSGSNGSSNNDDNENSNSDIISDENNSNNDMNPQSEKGN